MRGQVTRKDKSDGRAAQLPAVEAIRGGPARPSGEDQREADGDPHNDNNAKGRGGGEIERRQGQELLVQANVAVHALRYE